MATSFWEDPFLWYQEKVNPAPRVNGDVKAEVSARVSAGTLSAEEAAPYLQRADEIQAAIDRARREQIDGTKAAFSPANLVGEAVAPFAGLAGNLAVAAVAILVLYLLVTGRVKVPA